MSIAKWQPMKEFKEERTRPSYDLQNFSIVFPSAAKQLPFRAAWLEKMQVKIANDEVKKALQTWIGEHDKRWNPSGRPYDESNKRSNPSGGANPGDVATVLLSESEGPQDLKQLEDKLGAHLQISRQGQLFCVFPNGDLWVWGVEDGEITRDEPLFLVWGQFHLDNSAKALEDKPPYWPFEFTSPKTDLAFWSSNTVDLKFPTKPQTLQAFLEHLESTLQVNVNTLEFACHKLTAKSEKDGGGEITGRAYSIAQTKAVGFQPKPTPRKMEATWTDAGSFLVCGEAAKKWDWARGVHAHGHLQLHTHAGFASSDGKEEVSPAKAAIFVAKTFALKKGVLAKMA